MPSSGSLTSGQSIFDLSLVANSRYAAAKMSKIQEVLLLFRDLNLYRQNLTLFNEKSNTENTPEKVDI